MYDRATNEAVDQRQVEPGCQALASVLSAEDGDQSGGSAGNTDTGSGKEGEGTVASRHQTLVVTKECKVCGILQPIEHFCRNRLSKGGYDHRCISCEKLRKRRRRANNEGNVVEHEKQYRREHKEENAERSRLFLARNPGKSSEYNRRYRNRHPERATASDKKYCVANPDKVRLRHQLYRKKNGKHIDAVNAEWHKKHPEGRLAGNKRRRARKRHVICDLTHEQWQFILTVFDHKCAYCGRTMKRLTQDHVTPLFDHGPHTMANIVPACQSCNSKKGKGPPLIPVQPVLPLGC